MITMGTRPSKLGRSSRPTHRSCSRPWWPRGRAPRWSAAASSTTRPGCPGYVATIDDEPVGLLTYEIKGGALEVVTIDAVERRQGVGRALLEAAVKEADRQACWRLWLVTPTTTSTHWRSTFAADCGWWRSIWARSTPRAPSRRPSRRWASAACGCEMSGARAVLRGARCMRPRREVRPPSAHPSGARAPAIPSAFIPQHVAVVMDGNGRWAKQRGLRTAGHEAGEAALFDLVEGAIEIGVRHVSAFAFSTENWRAHPIVRFLMGFNRDVIRRRRDEMHAMGVRVRWAGRRPRLWKSVIDELEEAERLTADNTVLTLTMCVNYGGQAEIADAAARIAADARAGRLVPDKVDEKVFARYLDEPELPDVDLFLRSSGEQRISNFMLWQSRMRAGLPRRAVAGCRPAHVVARDRGVCLPRPQVRRRAAERADAGRALRA